MDIGGLRPVAAQHVAEVLGIPVENINPQVGDTETIGYTSMTGGSGGAFKTGWASYEAAQDVKRQLLMRPQRPSESVCDSSVSCVLQRPPDAALGIFGAIFVCGLLRLSLIHI